ncbi:MAG TPA: flavodoxin domain-containing protein, partial [Chitinophagaceae bacterium]|nr:flavodoxin domain-containing protein [Chitinophagaceae bacterium]
MLEEKKLKQLHELIDSYSKEELIWINGYLSGIVSNGKTNGAVDIANGKMVSTTTKRISLAFGTETGNAKRLATSLAAVAKKRGVNAKLVGLDQYRLTDLQKEDYFFVVISTQGEGEPPIPAKKFYDHLHEQPLALPNLKYSVLALGDTSYPLFCKTGEDVDAQFEKLGGRRVIPIQKCDVEYEADAAEWFEKVLALVNENRDTPAETPAPAKPSLKKPAGKK